MILSETKVWTPEGWKEARFLTEGEEVYSWNGRRWVGNTITKVREGQSRTTISIVCLDGMAPTVLRCTPDQQIRLGRLRFLAARELVSGVCVICSEGANVFQAEIGCVERETHDQPESTLGFDLAGMPRNFLAAGMVLR